MLHPTIDELTREDYNRYEIALATAKCARLITDEYVKQKEAAEKTIAMSKDADRTLLNKINKEFREEKAVKNALNMIKSGEYKLVRVDSSDEISEKTEEAFEDTQKEEIAE